MRIVFILNNNCIIKHLVIWYDIGLINRQIV